MSQFSSENRPSPQWHTACSYSSQSFTRTMRWMSHDGLDSSIGARDGCGAVSSAMRPGSPPLPALGGLSSTRILLRDGTVATLRATTPADRQAIRSFFDRLCPESRHQRFLSYGDVSPAIVDALCVSSDLTKALALAAWRQIDDEERPIAIASVHPHQPRHSGGRIRRRRSVPSARTGDGTARTPRRRRSRQRLPLVPGCDRRRQPADARSVSRFGLRAAIQVGSGHGRRPAESRAVGGWRGCHGRAASPSHARLDASDPRAGVGGGHRCFPRAGRHGAPHFRRSGRQRLPRPSLCRQSARLRHRRPRVPTVRAQPARAGRPRCGCRTERRCAGGRRGLRARRACARSSSSAPASPRPGPRDVQQQDAMLEMARGHGMRMVGPNCMGVLNTAP